MEDKVKKNNRIALAGGLLLLVLGYVILYFLGPFIGESLEKKTDIGGIGYLVSALIMLAFLEIYQFANRKTYEGCFKGEKIWLGILMLLPYVLVGAGIPVLRFAVGLSKVQFTWMALFMSIEAAICEDIAFRAVPAAHMMRFYEDGKKIPLVCFITSAAFGLVHITNIDTGMSIAYVLMQVFHAFGAGMLFCAVYLRTGSIIPAFTAHFLNDVTLMLEEGTLTGEQINTKTQMPIGTYIFVACEVAIFIGLALFYIRPKKRDEILKLWAGKWHRQE